MDAKTLAHYLRLAAEGLRKEAAAVKREKMIKSAQALTAARGLAQFSRILKGEAK